MFCSRLAARTHEHKAQLSHASPTAPHPQPAPGALIGDVLFCCFSPPTPATSRADKDETMSERVLLRLPSTREKQLCSSSSSSSVSRVIRRFIVVRSSRFPTTSTTSFPRKLSFSLPRGQKSNLLARFFRCGAQPSRSCLLLSLWRACSGPLFCCYHTHSLPPAHTLWRRDGDRFSTNQSAEAFCRSFSFGGGKRRRRKNKRRTSQRSCHPTNRSPFCSSFFGYVGARGFFFRPRRRMCFSSCFPADSFI